jgi:hypothetical protein
MTRKTDTVRDYPFCTAGFLEHPDGGFGEFVVAPQSETLTKNGATYVKDAFLKRLRAKEKSNG